MYVELLKNLSLYMVTEQEINMTIVLKGYMEGIESVLKLIRTGENPS